MDRSLSYGLMAFAFAILDDGHDTLYLYRDSFGIKPLFYTQQNGMVLFGSEPKAILSYPGDESSSLMRKDYVSCLVWDRLVYRGQDCIMDFRKSNRAVI